MVRDEPFVVGGETIHRNPHTLTTLTVPHPQGVADNLYQNHFFASMTI